MSMEHKGEGRLHSSLSTLLMSQHLHSFYLAALFPLTHSITLSHYVVGVRLGIYVAKVEVNGFSPYTYLCRRAASKPSDGMPGLGQR